MASISQRLAVVNDNSRIEKLVSSKKGILLDISFGGTPQPRSVVLGPRGDVKQNPTVLPLRLPNDCVHSVVTTHVLEYLEPNTFFEWFDELHRIMKPDGIAMFSGPYGGDESQGWLSDPSHRIRIVEQSFAWFDPRTPFYAEHEGLGRFQPRPWHTLAISRVPGTHGTISYNATMQAVKP